MPGPRSCRLAVAACVLLSMAARAAPAPGSDEEVTIETSTPGIRLAGTLSLPAGKGPFAVALLVHGDGPHTRDQLVSKTPMFRLIGEELVRRGIAVLRYDKRGQGRSTGPKSDEDSTTDELAGDALDCVHYLRGRPEIDRRKIGLVGHSEGAIIAPMVAQRDHALAFVVLLAPTAVPDRVLWISQKTENLARLGATPEVVKAVGHELGRLADFIVAGKNDDETYYRLGHDFLAAHGVPEKQNTHAFIDQLISDFRHRWYRFFLAYDPTPALKQLTAPSLSIFGEKDDQVTVKQNLPPLAAALAAAPDVTLAVLPDQDHFFFVFHGRRLDKHRAGEMEMAPALLATMGDWIVRHVR